MPTSLLKKLTLLFRLRGAGKVNTQVSGLTARMNKLKTSMAGVGKVGRTAFLGIAVALGGAVFAASSFESAFAGIIKTVDDAADAEGNLTKIGEKLRAEVRALALVLPVSANELAGIGEIAGQLGIKSKDIIGFTSVIARLAATTNILGQEGSLALAKFLNITKVGVDELENLGSTIVALGNNFAAQEAEILRLAQNLAVLSGSVGFSAQDILALATVIEASGGEAFAASTAFQRLGLEMDKAIAIGGQKLRDFADIAGVSAREFARVFKDDAFNALKLFLRGIKDAQESGQNLAITLEKVGFRTVRMTREIGKVIANLDQLEQAQIISKLFQFTRS